MSQDVPRIGAVTPASGDAPPMRTLSGDVYQRLRDLNASLPKRGRLDRTAVLLEMASLAWRLEALQTTRDLLTQIDLAQSTLLPAQRLTHTVLAINVALAFGETEKARSILLGNLDLALRDDTLAVAAAELIDAGADDSATRLARATLPSGAANAFYLAPRAHTDPLLLSKVSQARAKGGPDDDSLLLFANAVRHTSSTSWTRYWNRYLAAFDLPEIRTAEPAISGNVLSTVTFEKSPRTHAGPYVSILMSAFNAQETIAYSIRSILSQSHSNLELLVCDDGSTDSTIEEASRITDPRLRIYRSERNQGTYNVRNALIAQAKGALIGFQDADDFSLPTRITIQIDEMQRTGARAATASWIRIRADGEAIYFRDGRCRRLCAVSLLASREVFTAYGPYRSVQCGADTEFIESIRANLGEDQVIRIEKPLVLGLWSNQSLTRSAGTEALSDGYRAPARRAYAEIAARQRLLGKAIVTDADIAACLERHQIWRDPAKIVRLR